MKRLFLAAGLLGALALPAAAGAQVRQVAGATAPVGQAQVVTDQNAEETRSQLREVLRRYPPQFGSVLNLDPSLMSNPGYMASYPLLQDFVTRHPDVLRNPQYYFAAYAPHDRSDEMYTPQRQALDMWRSIIDSTLFLIGFVSVVLAISWIVRSIIEHRRWSRLTKVQSDMHNKLIDRLASSEETLAYLQSAAGSDFLRTGPGQMDFAAPKSVHAPYTRILWSAQAGVVLLALGLGLRWANVNAPGDVSDMLHFFGLIGQSLGIGFLVSAVLSFVLSRRMGLLADAVLGVERGPSRHS